MKLTVTIDDELFKQAVEAADPSMRKADVLREALRTFVRVKAAQRLAALGGTMPTMKDIPRRRPESTR